MYHPHDDDKQGGDNALYVCVCIYVQIAQQEQAAWRSLSADSEV
jgi:hypothetical protein